MENYLQITSGRPMTDEELLAYLRSGVKFSLDVPGDWEFLVGEGNRFVLRRTR